MSTPNSLDHVYTQLRTRRLADTRLLVSIGLDLQNDNQLQAFIQQLKSCKQIIFHDRSNDCKNSLLEMIKNQSSFSKEANLYLLKNNMRLELIFVFFHEVVDGFKAIELITQLVGVKTKKLSLPSIKKRYLLPTTFMAAKLLHLNFYRNHLFNPEKTSKDYCAIHVSQLRNIRRGEQTSLENALLIHISRCVYKSLTASKRSITIGKLIATPQNHNNNFSIDFMTIRLKPTLISKQIIRKFKNTCPNKLMKISRNGGRIPFFMTRKIVDIFTKKIDLMFSFVPAMLAKTGHENIKIEIKSFDICNGIFVYAVKLGPTIHLSYSINSTKIDRKIFNEEMKAISAGALST